MKRTPLISLFFIIAVSITTLLILGKDGDELTASNANTKPDAFMLDVNYAEYDDTGHLHSHLLTPKIIQYPYQNAADFINPNFMIYTEKHVPWYISADFGKSFDGIKTINLRNNVVIHQPSQPSAPETTITTETATVYPDKSMASSQDNVIVVRPDSWVRAKGMETNFKTGVIKLLSHSRGIYDAGIMARTPVTPKTSDDDNNDDETSPPISEQVR